MRLIVYIDMPEDFLPHDHKERPTRATLEAVKRKLSNAFDHYWEYDPMGTVRVIDVVEQEQPSERELIGPLG